MAALVPRTSYLVPRSIGFVPNPLSDSLSIIILPAYFHFMEKKSRKKREK